MQMFATFLDHGSVTCGKPADGVTCILQRGHFGHCNGCADRRPEIQVRAGDLVKVEVPANCAVYATSPVTAKEVAWSWFRAALDEYFRDEYDEDPHRETFERLWEAGGILQPGEPTR